MKKAIPIISVLLVAASAIAQGGLLTMNRRDRSRPQLLEPLLPFPEAVEKAKSGNPQGYYALAIHYAKGEVIECDKKKARQFMQKANAANYGNAAFVCAMLNENDSCNFFDGSCVPFSDYTGVAIGVHVPPRNSLTDETYVATIRAGYERAINLGVSVATNELARFERRVEAIKAQAKKDADTAKRKAENAKLVEGL